MWNGVFQLLKERSRDDIAEIYPDCLAFIRILSREKSHLNKVINIEQIECLLNIANIGSQNVETTAAVSAEALKALCNLVYLSTTCQKLCLKSSVVDGIVKRLRAYR